MSRSRFSACCVGLLALGMTACEAYMRQEAACEQIEVAFCDAREHCGGVDASACSRTLSKRRECSNVDIDETTTCVNALNDILAEDCEAFPTDVNCPSALWARAGEACVERSECAEGLLCRSDDGVCVTPEDFCQPNASLGDDGVTCTCNDGFFEENGECKQPPFQCGQGAHYDPPTNGCVCDPGFIASGGADCIDDGEAYCDGIGTTNATFCDPATETCPCGATFGEGYIEVDPNGDPTGFVCCCNAGLQATGNGRCE